MKSLTSNSFFCPLSNLAVRHRNTPWFGFPLISHLLSPLTRLWASYGWTFSNYEYSFLLDLQGFLQTSHTVEEGSSIYGPKLDQYSQKHFLLSSSQISSQTHSRNTLFPWFTACWVHRSSSGATSSFRFQVYCHNGRSLPVMKYLDSELRQHLHSKMTLNL